MTKKLFIHIPKNAGSTIGNAESLKNKIVNISPKIQRYPGYSKAVLDNVRVSPDDHILQEHSRWVDLNPDITLKYTSFAVIRNPWSRVASRYFYALHNLSEGQTVAVDTSSFEAFIAERHYWSSKPYIWHSATRGWNPALDYVTNERGELVCDMLPFENLDESLCKYFGLLAPPMRYNVTGVGEGKYMDIYNRDTINIIGDWYSRDIEMFGYDFDSGPKKNYWKFYE